MDGFGHQNVIDELFIEQSGEIFTVHFRAIYGCDLKFECRNMELTGINVFDIEKPKYIPDIEKLRAAALAARHRDKNKY